MGLWGRKLAVGGRGRYLGSAGVSGVGRVFGAFFRMRRSMTCECGRDARYSGDEALDGCCLVHGLTAMVHVQTKLRYARPVSVGGEGVKSEGFDITPVTIDSPA